MRVYMYAHMMVFTYVFYARIVVCAREHMRVTTNTARIPYARGIICVRTLISTVYSTDPWMTFPSKSTSITMEACVAAASSGLDWEAGSLHGAMTTFYY